MKTWVIWVLGFWWLGTSLSMAQASEVERITTSSVETDSRDSLYEVKCFNSEVTIQKIGASREDIDLVKVLSTDGTLKMLQNHDGPENVSLRVEALRKGTYWLLAYSNHITVITTKVTIE